MLLSPAVPDRQPETKPIKVAFRDAGLKACSVEDELFGYSGRNGTARIRFPAIETWRDPNFGSKIESALGAFLVRLENNCLGESGSVRAVDLVEESLPGPPSQSLYSRYRFRVGDGFIDLKPGSSIKVERAHFRPGQPQTLSNYLGTTALEFECLAGEQGGPIFRSSPIVRDPHDLNVQPQDLPEARLPDIAKGMPYSASSC